VYIIVFFLAFAVSILSRFKKTLSDERGEIAMDVIVVGMLVLVLALMSAPLVYLALTGHTHH
jgi:uncharacterized membrane protein